MYMSKPKRRRTDAKPAKPAAGKPRKAPTIPKGSQASRPRRANEVRPGAPAKSTVDFTGVKAFEGSRTHRKRREELPTDWPSKPTSYDQYEWFNMNEGEDVKRAPDMNRPCTVYVPVAEATAIVGSGAALIGTPQGPNHVLEDFEDGRYAPAAYADLCDRAYGRHAQLYPTVARVVFSNDLVIEVGSYDPRTGTVSITDPVAFRQWTGSSSTTLVTTDGPAARRRQWEEFLANRPDVAFVPALRRQYARTLGIEDDTL